MRLADARLTTALRVLMGLLFCVSAFLKASHIDSIHRNGTVLATILGGSEPLYIAFVAIEEVIGAALVLNLGLRVAAGAALAIVAGGLALQILGMVLRTQRPCGCFGETVVLHSPAVELLRQVTVLAGLVVVFRSTRSRAASQAEATPPSP